LEQEASKKNIKKTIIYIKDNIANHVNNNNLYNNKIIKEYPVEIALQIKRILKPNKEANKIKSKKLIT